MKYLICVAALMIAGAQTFAEGGKLSQTELNSFGLSGIQLLSDAEGMDVRGTSSTVEVEGKSKSYIGGSWFSGGETSTENKYEAKANNHNSSIAEGGSLSFSHGSTSNSGSINYQGSSNVNQTWNYEKTFTIGSGGGAFAFAD